MLISYGLAKKTWFKTNIYIDQVLCHFSLLLKKYKCCPHNILSMTVLAVTTRRIFWFEKGNLRGQWEDSVDEIFVKGLKVSPLNPYETACVWWLIDACNPSSGQAETDPWGSLSSQSCLLGRFRPVRDPVWVLTGKIVPEKWNDMTVVLWPGYAHPCAHMPEQESKFVSTTVKSFSSTK